MLNKFQFKIAVLVERKHPVLILQISLYAVERLPYLLYTVLVSYKDGLYTTLTLTYLILLSESNKAAIFLELSRSVDKYSSER